MFGMVRLTPDQVTAYAQAMGRHYADRKGQPYVPLDEQCVNCNQRAEDNGWCEECWGDLQPRRIIADPD